MKQLLLLVVLVLLLAAIPIADALPNINDPKSGPATNSRPFIFIDKKVNLGESYHIYVTDADNKIATMKIEQYDKNGKLNQVFPPWAAKARWAIAFNGGKGPTFTVLKIAPSVCNKAGKCTEDRVWLLAQ